MSDSAPSISTSTTSSTVARAHSLFSPTSTTTSAPQLMDSREPLDGSSVPRDAQADGDHLISNTPKMLAQAGSVIANEAKQPIQPPHPGMSTPAPKDVNGAVQSLIHLDLNKDEGLSNGKGPSARPHSEGSTIQAMDEQKTSSSGPPSGSDPSLRLLSRNDESSTESAQSSLPHELSSPQIVVSLQEPFAHQLQQVLANPIDQPDPRLLDALENPRDRLYVIKLEKDIIKFVQEKACEIHDLPPINSYHRLLAHKTAEYYRLTHVADATGSSVRIYRGQAARIPPTRLCDWPLTNPTRETTTNNAAPAVKIMRRAPSDRGATTPPKESSTPRKDGSDTSSEPDSVSTKANTREEREAAYQEARARIFKDFVESPPETPPPGKAQEKSKRPKEPDDFSGRSQFYPVVSQPNPYATAQQYYSQPQYQEPALQPQNYPQSSQYNVAPRFNPASASFTPSSGSGFTPSNLPYMSSQVNRQPFPGQSKEAAYSSHPSQQLSPQSVYPPRNSPMPNQTSPASSYNGIPRQHGPPSIQSSFSNGSSTMGGSQGFQQGFSPPAQNMNRPQYPVPGSFSQSSNLNQNLGQRMPTSSFGWNGTAVGSSVQMGPRSSSAPGHTGMDMQGSSFPYLNHGNQLPPPQQQAQWNTGISRNGMGNGMSMGGINSMNGMNGMNTMNGMNGVSGMSGMRGGFGGQM